MAPWILLALLGLGAAPSTAAADAEVHAVWFSYPWWRLPKAQKETLASYLADKGVNQVYLHDIPTQNWGPAEWAADFDAMKAIGIDTVILIRAGYREMATFDSRVLRERMGILPVREDLVDLFLRAAERCGMAFYFGTYDSGRHWVSGDYAREVEVNQAFCDEVIERYGSRPAFQGYSITREATDWEAFRTTDTWTFSHFPEPEHGEWYGYLDRRGEVTHRFKGGPYKGCFHVPRPLWLCWRLLQRLEAET